MVINTGNIKNKLHKDPADFRPDITHQSLLSLLGSPLNKAGFLEVLGRMKTIKSWWKWFPAQSAVTSLLKASKSLSTKGQLISIHDKIKEINLEGSIVFLVGGVSRGNPIWKWNTFNNPIAYLNIACLLPNALKGY